MRSKKILFYVISIMLSTSVWGQKDFEVADADFHFLTLEKNRYVGSEKIPFKRFIIKDFRFDTTKFGYLKNSRVVLEKTISGGLSELLNEHYKNNLDSSSEISLVIILKKLWIQRDAEDIVFKEKIRESWTNESRTGACIADIDVFCLSQHNYYPLIKIIDNFFYHPYKANNLQDFILLPFDSLVKKYVTINPKSVIQNKKAYTWEEIKTNYLRRFELPILSADSTPKGVFLTFESFKKNETVYPDFSIKKSKLTHELYVMENGSENLLLDFWGYYDGKDHYIKSGYNFYKLARQNNTWDIYGSKFITENHSQFSLGQYGTLNTINTRIDKKFLQLDMETGKVY